MAQLILASASPRRRELLGLLGVPFVVRAAQVPEDPQDGEEPALLATRLACAKAGAVLAALSAEGHIGHGDLVIGCDTVVAQGARVLGKPRDAHEAAAMLASLRGRDHEVISAVAVACVGGAGPLTQVCRTRVRMRRYSDAEIEAYVASGDPLDKAGAYAIQHAGFHPVARCTGCYANVVGLPLCHLTRALRARGIGPPVDVPAACQAYTGRTCSVYRGILGAA